MKEYYTYFSDQYANLASKRTKGHVLFEGIDWIISVEDFTNGVEYLKGLIENLTKPNDIISFEFDESSTHLIPICFWAALVSNRVYLPIIHEAPNERKNELKKISKAHFLCTKGVVETSISNQCRYSSENNAYILTTSGSTGRPKLVPISYHNLFSYSKSVFKEIQITKESVLYTNINYHFDVIIPSLISPILTGCTSIILRPQESILAEKSSNLFLKSNIVIQVPTWADLFFAKLRIDKLFARDTEQQVKTFIFCGEQLNPSTVKNLRQSIGSCEVYNAYGPSEATVWVTAYKVEKEIGEIVSIGVPHKGTDFIILNESLTECDLGMLYISGDQLFEGYLGSEKNPFIKYQNKKFYRTGDICKVDNCGRYYILGREDEQIKRKGYRIELAEIDSFYKKHLEGVKTIFCEGKIITYYTGCQVAEKNLIRMGLNSLNHYSIPDVFVNIDHLPTLDNGKIDRQALIKLHRDNYNE
ncbi:AMP-binding protein [Vibrio vulnificus]|uniref:AMP-binding protein n=1 Tax=Vibrio vulnificus TaxID=672 RepID=UPI001EEA26B5|nr:AMP-binding protein [Vibrio vulnificus]MCG6313282.1 AMP-binding protein [Vibrio vulnificus]